MISQVTLRGIYRFSMPHEAAGGDGGRPCPAGLQVEVGTMVKAGDDVDVYAFASVLDLQRVSV